MAPARTSLSVGSVLLRAFWVAIFAAHCWPLVKVVGVLAASPGEFERWWSLAGLLAALAVFGAKALDVRWLRVSSAPMGAVLFLVACGIVHGDRAIEGHSAATAIAVTTSAAAGVLVVRHRKKIAELFGGLATAARISMADLPPAYLAPDSGIAVRRGWLVMTGPPRAPPF